MRESGNAEARRYHHGDLSRALIDAARRILEAEGPAALSLRAVAREAGVSPAAPYHHFKDKTELLEAVAHQGWEALGETIAQARANSPSKRETLSRIGLGYIRFAKDNPALYRLMYDTTRDRTAMPDHSKNEDSGYFQVQAAILDTGANPCSELELQIATIASWCAAHGLAEMAGFKEFEPIKEAMGGEEPFLLAVLDHIGIFSRHTKPAG